MTSFDVDATINFKGKDEKGETETKNEGLELDSDSDSGYGEEEEKEPAVDVIPEEPKKKEGKSFLDKSLETKTLSKKEKKALEDAEFEALLGNVTVQPTEAKKEEKVE